MSLPALLGGAPVAGDTYPSWPQWGEREREELLGTLDSGAWWTGDGDRAFEFATAFARVPGCRRAACPSRTERTRSRPRSSPAGRRGRRGDRAGHDVRRERDRRPLGQRHARASSTSTPRRCASTRRRPRPRSRDKTRAIIAVHVAGAVSDLDLLVPLCESRGLHLIEDCAHAHGSQWRGRGVGSYGSFGSFSMQQGKLITAGEGGALIGNDERAARDGLELRRLRPRARPLVLPPRHDRLELPHDASGRAPCCSASSSASPHSTRSATRTRSRSARRSREIPGLRAAEARRAHGQPGQLLLRLPLRRREFAGMPLRRFEEALDAEGVPLGVSYPSLSDLELFRTAQLRARRGAPRRRRSTTRSLHLPVAEHAAASTVVDRAPHPAGRSRPRAARRRGRRSHPGARGRDHGEVADRRRRVTPRLALLGCGWVADMHARAAADLRAHGRRRRQPPARVGRALRRRARHRARHDRLARARGRAGRRRRRRLHAQRAARRAVDRRARGRQARPLREADGDDASPTARRCSRPPRSTTGCCSSSTRGGTTRP